MEAAGGLDGLREGIGSPQGMGLRHAARGLPDGGPRAAVGLQPLCGPFRSAPLPLPSVTPMALCPPRSAMAGMQLCPRLQDVPSVPAPAAPEQSAASLAPAAARLGIRRTAPSEMRSAGAVWTAASPERAMVIALA
jgi:hypothetical protein